MAIQADAVGEGEGRLAGEGAAGVELAAGAKAATAWGGDHQLPLPWGWGVNHQLPLPRGGELAAATALGVNRQLPMPWFGTLWQPVILPPGQWQLWQLQTVCWNTSETLSSGV